MRIIKGKYFGQKLPQKVGEELEFTGKKKQRRNDADYERGKPPHLVFFYIAYFPLFYFHFCLIEEKISKFRHHAQLIVIRFHNFSIFRSETRGRNSEFSYLEGECAFSWPKYLPFCTSLLT
jgi:hypothetical protein